MKRDLNHVTQKEKVMIRQFNWKAEFKQAKETGKFSREAIAAAHEWSFCAIGEKYKLGKVAKSSWSCINALDIEEDKLGVYFMHLVDENDINGAIEAYDKIMAMSVNQRVVERRDDGRFE